MSNELGDCQQIVNTVLSALVVLAAEVDTV
jgi:hypothetical protein